MLYHAYQIQCDAFAPVRLFAETARRWLGQPWPVFGDLPAVRGAAAAMDLLSHAGVSHERPAFAIDRVTVDGADIPVVEETVAVRPFCKLVHFRKDPCKFRGFALFFKFALAPSGAHVGRSIQKNLQIGVGEHHRSDIAALHHHAALFAGAALLGHHRMTDPRNHRNDGSGVGHFRRTNRVRDVFAVKKDAQLSVLRHEIDSRRSGEHSQSVRRIERDAVSQRF